MRAGRPSIPVLARNVDSWAHLDTTGRSVRRCTVPLSYQDDMGREGRATHPSACSYLTFVAAKGGSPGARRLPQSYHSTPKQQAPSWSAAVGNHSLSRSASLQDVGSTASVESCIPETATKFLLLMADYFRVSCDGPERGALNPFPPFPRQSVYGIFLDSQAGRRDGRSIFLLPSTGRACWAVIAVKHARRNCISTSIIAADASFEKSLTSHAPIPEILCHHVLKWIPREKRHSDVKKGNVHAQRSVQTTSRQG